ncbi:UNVERIFIED_CONTAM: hypothetical protein Sradi_7082800 [Sesamum radiatum]|uniref:Integrase catalytic domain-containing protein n=1 Tax=Sesamum radiatum TaxID=300843 RepID=A0AAW2J3I0_SESRA
MSRQKGRLISSSSILSNTGACRRTSLVIETLASLAFFWTELFKILGSRLSMSSSYHPQSDGQTERFNSMWRNTSTLCARYSEGLGEAFGCRSVVFQCPKELFHQQERFEIVTGQQPLLPHTLDSPQGVRSPLARSFSQSGSRMLISPEVAWRKLRSG